MSKCLFTWFYLGTKTGRALRYAAEICFTKAFGDRAKAQNVLIVLTDGRSSDNVKIGSDLLREQGVGVSRAAQLQSHLFKEK